MKEFEITTKIQIEAEDMEEAKDLADLILDSLREDVAFNRRMITSVGWDMITPVWEKEEK